MAKHLLRKFQPRTAVALASLCAAAGLLTVWSTVRSLYQIWTSDDLKSMGMVVPLVCYLLILRAWRSLGWETEGSWWGFAVLAGSAALMFLRDQMLLIVTVNKDWLLQLPPLPLVAVVYAAAMVLLFGGRRLLKAAWFPVLLMWAVIPVPQTFSRRVDLPLQHASATVARAWAHVLGQQLTQDKLRLCLLVVYYKIALPYPWLQHHAKIADYIIGGCLFLCALGVFFTVADKLRQQPADTLPAPAAAEPVTEQPRSVRPMLFRAAAVLVMAGIFGVDVLHEHKVTAAAEAALPAAMPMPATIGNFTLVRTWTESQFGFIIYVWGEYAAPTPASGAPGPHVMLGVSPQSVHDAEVCHIARGDDPTWHGEMTLPSAAGNVMLTAATYNDGVVQKLEASTVCDGGVCRQYGQTGEHMTLIYARPHRNVPLQADTTRPIPLMMKVESLDTMAPVSVVEPQLAATLAEFVKSADFATLTTQYGKRDAIR